MSVDKYTKKKKTPTHRSNICVITTIKDICKSKAGILMEDILESDSGLFSKDQTAFSSQKPLYHLVFLCIRYPHFSLNDLRRIMCSHVSFLYCQNVSLGDQLGERSWYTVQRFFFCLSLKQYEHSFCSWWEVPSSEYGQVSSFWVVRECVCVWVNVCVCACVCECFNMFSVIGWMSSVWCCHTWNLCDDLIPSLSAGLSWC